MSYKIQITVDDQLGEAIRGRAKNMGLSISTYARLALMSVLSNKNNKLLPQAIKDIKSNHINTLTLAEFNRQLDDL